MLNVCFVIFLWSTRCASYFNSVLVDEHLEEKCLLGNLLAFFIKKILHLKSVLVGVLGPLQIGLGLTYPLHDMPNLNLWSEIVFSFNRINPIYVRSLYNST